MNRLVRTIPAIGVAFDGLQLVVSVLVAVLTMQRAGIDVLAWVRGVLGLDPEQGGVGA